LNEEAEQMAEAKSEAPKDARDWLGKIKSAEREMEKWRERCDKIDKLLTKESRAESADREMSVFWANMEVLKPATYARMPIPVVAPRFKTKNNLAGPASDILERSLIVAFEQSDIDGVMREVRDELLLYGRGTAWVRLSEEDGAPVVAFDEVERDDFIHDMVPAWRKVRWVARRVRMTKEEGLARFGDVFEQVPMDKTKREKEGEQNRKEQQACVYEVWCKTSRFVYWVGKDCPVMLDAQPAFLTLKDFFPCPKPAYGTRLRGRLIPVPDIVQYTDQIEEINEMTARIAAVSETLRMRGFYPAGQGELSEAIEAAIASVDNRSLLIPISSFAAFGSGGFKDQIVWFPVVDALNLIKGLIELRRVLIEDVYQVTGISDIVRGSTEASETATAQQIKSQWGSLRIRERQNELARVARDLARIAAEIMAENFDAQTLQAMSQVQLADPIERAKVQQMQEAGQEVPPAIVRRANQPTLDEVVQFLRDDRTRGFTIEIETDSTIQPDEDAEKQRRVEFTTAIGGFIQSSAPLVLQAPQLGPFIAEVMKFAAGGFRAGRPLEAAIDTLAEQLEQAAQVAMQPKEPPVDPKIEMEKQRLAADMEERKARFEMDKQEKAARLQMEREHTAAKLAMEQQKAQAELNAMVATREAETSLKRDLAMGDMALKARSMVADQDRANAEMAAKASEQTEGDDGEDKALLQGLAEMADAIRSMGEAIVKSNSAPKRLVRGPDGRATGVETVM
jgi:hypothetical protein